MTAKEKIIKGVQLSLEKQHRLFIDSQIFINDKIVLTYRYKNDTTFIDIYIKDILCMTLSEFTISNREYYDMPQRAVDDILNWAEQQFMDNHIQGSMRQDIINNY